MTSKGRTSHHKPGLIMITLNHVTSHHNESDVSFSGRAVMTQLEGCHYESEACCCRVLRRGRQPDQLWGLTMQQHCARAGEKPCHVLTKAPARIQPFITSCLFAPSGAWWKLCLHRNLMAGSRSRELLVLEMWHKAKWPSQRPGLLWEDPCVWLEESGRGRHCANLQDCE